MIKWLSNFPPHPLSASHYLGKLNQRNNCIFILFRLFGFSQVMQKQTLGEVETKMVIWWQVVSKMFAPKIFLICQSFFKSQSIMLGMLFDVFLFISTHISLVPFSPGTAEADIADIGRGGILNGHLMASCARNTRAKNYSNWIFLLQVTIENVSDVFFSWTSCNFRCKKPKVNEDGARWVAARYSVHDMRCWHYSNRFCPTF